MIVRGHAGRLQVVRQVDHQLQCGLMANAWGNERFAKPGPDGVRLAAGIHDEGWRSWELRPRVNAATRRPLNFTEITASEHIPLYRVGIAAAAERDPYAGTLVSLHGEALQLMRLGLGAVPRNRDELPETERAFIAEQEALRSELKARIGDRPNLDAEIAANFALLKFWDRLSLYLCWQGLADHATVEYGPIPTDYSGGETVFKLTPAGPLTVGIDPYPFSSSPLKLNVSCRSIEDRDYLSDEDLQAALEEAPWSELSHYAKRVD